MAAEPADGAAGVRIEPVGRVSGPGGRIGAVGGLERSDVVQQGSGGVAPLPRLTVMIGARLALARIEVGHDCVFAGVLEILGAPRIRNASAGAGVIGAGMRQPERVADLVQVGDEAVASEEQIGVLVVARPHDGKIAVGRDATTT